MLVGGTPPFRASVLRQHHHDWLLPLKGAGGEPTMATTPLSQQRKVDHHAPKREAMEERRGSSGAPLEHETTEARGSSGPPLKRETTEETRGSSGPRLKRETTEEHKECARPSRHCAPSQVRAR